MTTRNTLIAITATLALTAIGAGPTYASGGDDVVRRGACTGSTHWKLKAGHDDGRIEIEAEVDSNRSGQVWDWKIRHNGSVSAKGASTTRGASGSFSVERRMANLAGTDHFTFRAERRANGDVCRGTISL